MNNLKIEKEKDINEQLKSYLRNRIRESKMTSGIYHDMLRNLEN